MSVEQWSDLLFSEAGPRDGHAYGSVRAVNEDGSYMVQLNASNTLTRCAPFCTAMVGDRVKVVINANGKCDAIGRLGGVETIAPTIAERFAELEARLAEAEYDTGWQNVYVIDSEIEVKVRRVGKMVTVTGFCWGYISLPSRQTLRLTTLPVKFRPSWSVPFNIATMGGEESFSESSEVGTDGIVSIYVTKAGISYWKFSVSYPAA